MFSCIFGFRVNLIHLAVAVACYDLVHIVLGLKQRSELFLEYENTDDGCIGDLFQVHCMAIYSDLAIYVVDFVFTSYLIYGAAKVGPTFL